MWKWQLARLKMNREIEMFDFCHSTLEGKVCQKCLQLISTSNWKKRFVCCLCNYYNYKFVLFAEPNRKRQLVRRWKINGVVGRVARSWADHQCWIQCSMFGAISAIMIYGMLSVTKDGLMRKFCLTLESRKIKGIPTWREINGSTPQVIMEYEINNGSFVVGDKLNVFN